MTRGGWNGIPGATYRTGIDSAEPLPRVGLRWQPDRRNQLFGSVSTNFRNPVGGDACSTASIPRPARC